ncbi:cytochrome P450 [Exophiala viscosa]|uniref:Cytochrome P450 n=1 Tax=Exophiala viscosa TaxID=2486360 RepID=A0AAN6E2U7_9EURO|nr:cytochrome P450 [Exophiala viscosa]
MADSSVHLLDFHLLSGSLRSVVQKTSIGHAVLYLSLASIASIILPRIYSAYFGPLSKIPGPKLAALTNGWMLWHLWHFEKCAVIHEQFKKYGPIVRVGPNNVALNTTEDMKTVYAVGAKFPKSSFYDSWSFNGSPNVFSMRDQKAHADRRKVSSKIMSRNALVTYLPEINQHLRDFVRVCGKRAGTTVDFVTQFRFLALDVVGSAAFGKSFNLMRNETEHPFVHDLDACIAAVPPRGYFPTWVWWLITKIPTKDWQFALGGEKRICEYSGDIVDEQEERMKKNGGEMVKEDANTLVGKMINYRDENGAALPRSAIDGEIGIIFFAGTDTTSNTLAFMSYELARHKQHQDKLYEELKERMPVKGAVPDLVDAEAWPFLNAVIKETLRLYAVAPSQLERDVPKGGTHLHGKYIPEGTIVGVQNYSIHRKAEAFPDPETFKPERWFNETEDMRRHFMPFGLGSRICLGQNIAMLEMRLTIATLIRSFELTLPADHNPADVALKDFWLAFPASRKVELVCVPREE